MPIPAFREDGWLPEGHHRATWEEVVATFGGGEGSRRAELTRSLLALRDALRAHGVTGTFLLNGSYISAKPEPGDFDVLLIAPAGIQARKDANPEPARLLDAETAEQERGYSIYYTPEDSLNLPLLRSIWNETKDGVLKGSVEVPL